MRGLAVLILAALFALAGYATYALGDQPAVPRCATPAGMSASLAAAFGERPMHAGEIIDQQSGGVLSIHVHPTTRAWTAVVSSYDGRACVIAVGERWAAIPEREAARPP